MSATQVKMSANQNDTIDYGEVIKQFPWLVQKGQNCVLSPDIDGLLCGLLMTHCLDWRVVGFYDGKIVSLAEDVLLKECVFLDMEILRPDIRSVGHHMNIHSFREPPADYHEKMKNCLNPNHIRGFDRIQRFQRKYPLGTIHLLMYILENKSPGSTTMKPEGLSAIFFADGVWKVLFNYTENVLDWFEYLHSGAEADWWKKLKTLPILELIKSINSFLQELKSLRPDNGRWYGHLDLVALDAKLLRKVLELLSRLTGWEFCEEKWNLSRLHTHRLIKEIYGQNNVGSKSNRSFLEIWEKHPISLAMTEGTTIQYSLDSEGVFHGMLS